MKKFITIAIIAVMFGFANNAQATEFQFQFITKEQVAKNIIETIPVASPKEIDICYDAVKNGGFHRIANSKVQIICSKSEMTRVWTE